MKKSVILIATFLVAAFALAASAYAHTIPGHYIVVLKDEVSNSAVTTAHDRLKGVDIEARYHSALNGYAAELSNQAVKEIRSDPRVEMVMPDKTVTIQDQVVPTGISRVDAPISSTESGDGSGDVNVNVAVIDTGINASHPDLNVVGGHGCYSTPNEFEDGNGHGSHVAGTIAARDNGIGVVGIAPGARLWAVQVLSAWGSGSYENVICGIDWVTSTRTDKDPTNDIAVANMSLGGGGSDDGNCGQTNNDALHLAICNSVAAGVTYAVAAGNYGEDFNSFVPAAYDEVLTVTAVADFNGRPGGGAPATCREDTDDQFADFSNYATKNDRDHTIAMPGVCITSTWKSGGYNTISGTSMASPHAAGLAALCIAEHTCRNNPSAVMAKIRTDAAKYSLTHINYGFQGDPVRRHGNQFYGFLGRAGSY